MARAEHQPDRSPQALRPVRRVAERRCLPVERAQLSSREAATIQESASHVDYISTRLAASLWHRSYLTCGSSHICGKRRAHIPERPADRPCGPAGPLARPTPHLPCRTTQAGKRPLPVGCPGEVSVVCERARSSSVLWGAGANLSAKRRRARRSDYAPGPASRSRDLPATANRSSPRRQTGPN